MLLFFATLLVSTADVPAAHGASCVVRANGPSVARRRG